jgi:dihydrofolate reductase
MVSSHRDPVVAEREVGVRRLRYGVAVSLDGYIAGPNGEADWIVMDPEIDFAAMAREYDTMLMGRRTFDAMRAMGGGGGGGGAFGGMRVVVASRTLDPGDHRGVTVVAEPIAEAVTALKQESGRDIWLFGGGELCRSLLDLGLVDAIEVAVIPTLLGEGVPLVAPASARTTLALTDYRVYPTTGTVSLSYDVIPNGPTRPRRGA